jgi:putative SOS response-associated peptidase YedK
VVGGFFEWCANGTKKQPYFVELDPNSCAAEPPLLDSAKHESAALPRPTTSPLMYLASLFETTDDGKTFTFTVLTTAVADNLTWCESKK